MTGCKVLESFSFGLDFLLSDAAVFSHPGSYIQDALAKRATRSSSSANIIKNKNPQECSDNISSRGQYVL